MKNFVLLITFISTSFFYNCKEQKKVQSLQLVTTEEMQELMSLEDMQLVDVRTPSEYFDEQIQSLDKSKPIIVYCKSGGRSAKCASKLAALGFEKIYDLEGGFSQWKFKGLRVEN